MPRQTPDPLTYRDREGNVLVAPGSPLSRLQCAFDDEETGVFAGDLRDVCNACDQRDATVAKVVKSIGEKRKGDRVPISAGDVEYLTAMLVAPPAMQALEPTPAQIVASRENKARSTSESK